MIFTDSKRILERQDNLVFRATGGSVGKNGKDARRCFGSPPREKLLSEMQAVGVCVDENVGENVRRADRARRAAKKVLPA